MGYGCDDFGSALLLVGSAIASGLSAGRSVEEIALIAALFNVLGDSMELIAAVRSSYLIQSNGNDPQSVISPS